VKVKISEGECYPFYSLCDEDDVCADEVNVSYFKILLWRFAERVYGMAQGSMRLAIEKRVNSQ
jgi:hypothetical protein